MFKALFIPSLIWVVVELLVSTMHTEPLTQAQATSCAEPPDLPLGWTETWCVMLVTWVVRQIFRLKGLRNEQVFKRNSSNELLAKHKGYIVTSTSDSLRSSVGCILNLRSLHKKHTNTHREHTTAHSTPQHGSCNEHPAHQNLEKVEMPATTDARPTFGRCASVPRLRGRQLEACYD